MAKNEQPSTSSEPAVFVVVPAYNRWEKTLRFLRAFSKITYRNRHIVIVDDGSTDGTGDCVELNYPDVVVLRGTGSLWWSGATNLGVAYALEHGADYILTINDDSVMESDFLSHMVVIAGQDPTYIVGCRLHCEDRPEEIWAIGTGLPMRGGALFSLQFAGQRWNDVKDRLPDPFPVPAMPGNGVLIPRAVFEQVGLYDAKHMPQYHADTDLILRARRHGFQPVISLNSVLYNHILDKPLVDNRIDLVFSKKSDRYWRAVWHTIKCNAPFGKRIYLLLRQYSPFFLNGPIAQRCKRAIRRWLERHPAPQPEGIQRDYNPTCTSGPPGEEPKKLKPVPEVDV